MANESGNWLQSTERLCSVDFINPTHSKGTGIRAVTFFDVSSWTEEDIYKSKGAADGAVFLMRPATEENPGPTSMTADLEKYTLGFRHVIDQVCYRFRWRSSVTSRNPVSSMFLGNNSMFCNYASLPASKALLYILKHLMQISEKADLSSQDYCFFNVWDMIGLLSGLENGLDEVPIYAALLTSIVIYNVSQEIKAMRQSSKTSSDFLVHELASGPKEEAADSLPYSTAMEFASYMAKEVIDEGTYQASIKLMEPSHNGTLESQSLSSIQTMKTGSQQSMTSDGQPSEKVGDSEKQAKVSPSPSQAMEGTSQPEKVEKDHQALSLPSVLWNQQEGTSKGKNNYINALMVEDIWSPTKQEDWMDQGTEFKMSFAEYTYLLRLGLLEYIKQFASDLVDSILYRLVYGDIEEEEKYEDPILKSEFSKEEDLARFFLMLYANQLRGQILRAMMLLSQREQIYNELPWKLTVKADEKIESSRTADSPESLNVINKQKDNVNVRDHGPTQETPASGQNISVGPDSQVLPAEHRKQDSEQVLPDQTGTSPKLPPQVSQKRDILECIHKLMHYVVKDILSKSDSKWCQAIAKEIEKNLPFPGCDPNLEPKGPSLPGSPKHHQESPASQPQNAANHMIPSGVQELIDCLKEVGSVRTETGEYNSSLDMEMKRGWSIKIVAAASAQEAPEVLVINLNPSEKKNTQQLQAVLQWAAASQLKIPMLHFREADEKVLSKFPLVIQKAAEKEINVGTLLQKIQMYLEYQLTLSKENRTPTPVLDWLLENL